MKENTNRKTERTNKEFLLGKSIERCAVMVAERNRYNLNAFSALGILMMSFAIVFGWIMSDVFTFNMEFLIMWAYFLVMYAVNKFAGVHIKHSTAAFYLWTTPIMIMGIIIGTFGDPTQPSITIMVFLCVMPMFILDKPWRIVLFITANAIIYTICCYLSKTSALFADDMVDLVLFTVLGIGVNCLILKDRIDNVEHAMDMMLIAEIDTLTEISNRGAGINRINRLLQQGDAGMFLLIDFDNFKDINDHYGHTVGDKVLVALGKCLKQSHRNSDVVMRFGGDEFAVFVRGLENDEERKVCIERMMENIHSISIPEMPDYCFNVSVGISTVDHDNKKSFEKLYSESDKALYMTKRKGKNSYSFFTIHS